MYKGLRFLTYSLFFASCIVASAQEKKAEKAKNDIENYAYAEAIEEYELLVKRGYSDEEIYKNLGDANYLNAKYDAASGWYSKLFMVESANIDAEYMYRYAQSLKSMGEYIASDTWMEKFEAAKGGSDIRFKRFVEKKDYLKEIEEASGRYDIKNLAINSAESDFAPSFLGEDLVFSTARDSGIATKSIHEWTNKAFLNLYKARSSENGDFSSAIKLSKTMNKKTHESSTAFTKDGNTVYFTRNNSDNGKFARDAEGVSRLKIYRASLQNGEWTNITELPFNGDAHSTAHPALSADESKLYFASNMEGSIGKSDIFMVDINSDGSFGTPKNLGSDINTESRETFPFVTEDNTLYFASDGHPGLGGLDVFATNISDLDDTFIVNVGKPINSEEDDFSFVINNETGKGFFASNRDGGQGSDDIYAFTENEKIDLSCNTVVQGIIKDKETGEPLAGAKVAIFDSQSQVVAETVSGNDGNFTLDGDCKDGDYKVVASKEDYDDGNKMFAVVSANDTSGIEVALEKTLRKAAVGTNLITYLGLEPIYFDLDTAAIRPDASRTMEKVIAYMKEYPELKVQVQSHTDTKNSESYNVILSGKRAKNTVAYLVANGIDETRISGKGFGETQLTNECTTRESCPDEKHQENRRSEFIVVE